MRPKSFALLVLALGCGLVASIGITQVISKKGKTQVVSTGDTATIFVAMADIPLGDALTSQVLRLEQWPKDKVPTGVLTKIEDVEGRRARTKLYAGEPILDNKLFPKGHNGQGALIRIPKGYRAVPVKVDSVSGGSSLILPGDRVDVAVYVKRNPALGILETGVQDVLQDIKVFAVNNVVDFKSEGSDDQSITAKTITLLVTPPQSKKLILATELGQVRLVMRSTEDDQQLEAAVVSANDLFGKTDGADREAESLTAEPAAADPQPGFLDFLKHSAQAVTHPAVTGPVAADREQCVMRVVRGEEVEDVVLEMNEDQLASSTPRWKVSDSGMGFGSGGPAVEETPSVVTPKEGGTEQPGAEPTTTGQPEGQSPQEQSPE